MNMITDKMRIGTVGEILVQLRLLEYGVQAAPPIKDSGNDLIAIRGHVFRAIQVKTTTRDIFKKRDLPALFDLLAVVYLMRDEERLLLDQSRIFLVPRERIHEINARIDSLAEFEMTGRWVDKLFTD